MFTRILIATDFSPLSDAALAHARTLAGTFGAQLHLLHVLPNLFLRAVVNDPHGDKPAAVDQLLARLTAEDRARLQPVPVVERSDEPADEIVSYARTRDIGLIVMGTHGRHGMAHTLVGSVAEKVVRAAPCPVLTVRAVPRGETFTRVLVPTDFSGPSDAALDCARTIARRLNGTFHLMHVLEELAEVPPATELVEVGSRERRAAHLQEATERLAKRLTSDDVALLHATAGAVLGHAASAIVDYAADNGFDLIVMGTHGRTGLSHLLMGSVAERVIRDAPCAVVTMRHARTTANIPAQGGQG
ncbi:MAG: hypothetical protein A3G77_14625 [Acidobacteria bacterium RIFCSPLOWO2_12_FULL_68_19]|nr:MAG: hypothetical protein A3G77_14625 [Acidobacteria bacterium RIFCSPLOWO2_12_FULL_68_19]